MNSNPCEVGGNYRESSPRKSIRAQQFLMGLKREIVSSRNSLIQEVQVLGARVKYDYYPNRHTLNSSATKNANDWPSKILCAIQRKRGSK